MPPAPSMLDSSRLRPEAVWTGRLLAFLLIYTAWAWAGLRPSYHWVGVGTAGVLMVAMFLEGRGSAWPIVRRDPVFFLGLAFLGYLAIQWANAGRTQYFDVGYQRWTYTDPPWRGWPSAFARADAAQMLAWFFPAWMIAVAIRSRILDRHALRRLLTFVACSAGMLAVFGLVQYASGAPAIYWVQPLNSHFFASFAYGNHAGPYFVLAGGLAMGLLFREIFDVRNPSSAGPAPMRFRHPWRVAVLVPAAMLCGVGAGMGFSRAGLILAALLGGFAAGYLWMRAWPLLRPVGRLNLAALSLGVMGTLFFLVMGFGSQGIRKEFALRPAVPGTVRTAWDRINLELGGRPQFARAAVAIWREHPWFGVGGWGYKYLVASHVPKTQWPLLEKRGWANVHVDFLQFLAEFGLVGTGLLLAALGVLIRDLFAARQCRHNAFCVLGGVSLALTVVFSLVDIPFRCPAILYAWVALLAAMPAMGLVRPSGAPAAAAGVWQTDHSQRTER